MYAALFGFCLVIVVGAVLHHATTTAWAASPDSPFGDERLASDERDGR